MTHGEAQGKRVPNRGMAWNNFLHFTMADVEELDKLFLHIFFSYWRERVTPKFIVYFYNQNAEIMSLLKAYYILKAYEQPNK